MWDRRERRVRVLGHMNQKGVDPRRASGPPVGAIEANRKRQRNRLPPGGAVCVISSLISDPINLVADISLISQRALESLR